MANITDGNYLVYNQGNAPLVNNHFMLRVELLFDLPCKAVKGFTREMEYELIQEGGLNDYVHRRRKPNSGRFSFEVERYVGLDYIDPLPLGAELVLPVLLFVSRYQGQFIPGVVARTFVFTGCTVASKTYGELDAKDSGLMVETTRIDYNEMLCIDIPWSSADVFNIGSGPANPPTNAKTTSEPENEGGGTGGNGATGSNSGTGTGGSGATGGTNGTGTGQGSGGANGAGSANESSGTGNTGGAGNSGGTGAGGATNDSGGAADSERTAGGGETDRNDAGNTNESGLTGGENSADGTSATGETAPSSPGDDPQAQQTEPEEYENLIHLDV